MLFGHFLQWPVVFTDILNSPFWGLKLSFPSFPILRQGSSHLTHIPKSLTSLPAPRKSGSTWECSQCPRHLISQPTNTAALPCASDSCAPLWGRGPSGFDPGWVLGGGGPGTSYYWTSILGLPGLLAYVHCTSRSFPGMCIHSLYLSSCLGELLSLFMIRSLSASAPGPACPSQDDCPCTCPEYLKQSVLSPPPSSPPNTNTDWASPKHKHFK